MIKVGITGGIGGGKSTLCRHFRDSGVPHYDSDRRARELMNRDRELREQIVALLGARAYDDYNELNRAYVAEQIFGDETKREALNAVVHPAVMRDFEAWCEVQAEAGATYVLMESAILFDAGLDSNVDITVAVLAPVEMRVMRVVNRDGCSAEQAQARIDAQMSDDELHAKANYSVANLFEEDMADSAQRLDQIFKYEALKHSRNVNS